MRARVPRPSTARRRRLSRGRRPLGDEALRRLGVDTAPSRLERDYSVRKTTTQVSSGRSIAVSGQVRRKIGYNGATRSFERAAQAPR